MRILNCFGSNKKYFVIFGGFLIHLTLGLLYTSGNIKSHIISYMKNHSVTEKKVNKINTMWIFGLMLFGQGTAFSAGGFLERIMGPSLIALIGCLWASFNICITYWTIKTYLSVVIISYGLFLGTGVGLAYGAAFGAACSWFTNRHGLIIGMVVCGFGMSQCLFDSIQDYIIHRENDQLPFSFLVTGMLSICIQIVGSLLLEKKPEENIEERLSQSQSEISVLHMDYRLFNIKSDYKPHEILQEFDFWILWIIFHLNSDCINLITIFGTTYGHKLKLPEMMYLPIVLGMVNGLGRIFWGYLIDKIQFKVIMVIITLGTSFFMGTLAIFQLIDNHLELLTYLYGFWLCMLNLFMSGNYSIFPAVCGKLFGMKNIIMNYGLIFTATSFSGLLVCSVFSIYQNEHFTLKTFNYIYLTGSGLSLIAAAITLLFRGKSMVLYRYYMSIFPVV